MIGNNPLVSVLIPAYNHENYVQETIQSVINQTYANIEIIIIDDGSKDLTWQKISDMKEICDKRFKRTVFKTKENEGTTQTLNRLLNLAAGEYVYLIASDDKAKPSAIEKEVNFLKNNSEYALCVGNGEFMDKNGKVCYLDKKYNIVYSKRKAKYLTHADYLKKGLFDFTSDKFGTYSTLYYRNYIPNGYLIRKSIFEKTGLFKKEAPLEDWFLMLQISKYAKMKYLDEILFSYRQHDFNTMKNFEKIKEYENKTAEYEEKILENLNYDETLPDVKEVKEKGICYKKIGISHVLELRFLKKNGKKEKEFSIFNFKIKR